jgi:hypothetical protein
MRTCHTTSGNTVNFMFNTLFDSADIYKQIIQNMPDEALFYSVYNIGDDKNKRINYNNLVSTADIF